MLRPGGTYLSQQIGAGTNRELTDFMMGPKPVNEGRSAASAAAGRRRPASRFVELAGVRVGVEFFDVGAAGALPAARCCGRCPGFTPEAYDAELRRLHEQIERAGTLRVDGPPAPRRPRRPGLTHEAAPRGSASRAPYAHLSVRPSSDLAVRLHRPRPSLPPPGVVPRSRRAGRPSAGVDGSRLDRAHRHAAGRDAAPSYRLANGGGTDRARRAGGGGCGGCTPISSW